MKHCLIIFFLKLTVLYSELNAADPVFVRPKPVESALGLKLRIWPEKKIYQSGEHVKLSFFMFNAKGDAKRLQRGSAFNQYAIVVGRDGKELRFDSQMVAEGDGLAGGSFSPSDPIPVGKGHLELFDMSNVIDLTIPGKYKIQVRKWFHPKHSKIPLHPKFGVDYLDDTAIFEVVSQKIER